MPGGPVAWLLPRAGVGAQRPAAACRRGRPPG